MRFVIAGVIASTLSACADAEPLPSLKLNPEVTVSGLSSGAYMATQFHFAHNVYVTHAALLAGGPYDCAQGDLTTALARCVDKKGQGIPLSDLLDTARKRAAGGNIDPLSALQADQVWVFHGTEDHRVLKDITDASVAFYQALMPEKQVQYVTDVAAGHGFPTEANGVACGTTDSPFINACQWDAAKQILTHAYGELKAPATALAPQAFDQALYAKGGKHTLAEKGYVYIPQSCRDGESCRLHIAFHGCKQNAEMIADQFIQQTGFNRWAESNNIVVLYPQTTASMMPLNPAACWDWWGYTGEHYATKQGEQVKQIANMVRALGIKL